MRETKAGARFATASAVVEVNDAELQPRSSEGVQFRHERGNLSRMMDRYDTERLSLRHIRAGDWPELRELDGDPEVMATLGGLRSEKETMGYAMAQEDHWQRHGFGWWMAHDLETGAFVGRGGIRYLEIEGVTEVEVGYAIVRDRWGGGFATEIAGAGIRLAREGVGLSRVVGLTLTTNDASRRVLEKVGLRYERDVTHAGLPHVLYSWEAAPS